MNLSKQTKILIIAPLFFILSACGGGSSSDSSANNPVTICPRSFDARIINGQSCEAAGSPIVRLNVVSAKGVLSICSGSVVSSNKVLTAAHCFLIGNVASVSVENDQSVFPANKVFVHPEFAIGETALFNDVAIVQTTRSMNLPTMPILLSQDIKKGQKIGINGFGIDNSGEIGILKGGTMQISSVTTNHIGANFNGKDSNTCNGDSGGPATFTINNRPSVIGITSSGIKTDCSKGDVTLFTNIQSQNVLDFITSIVPEIGTL